MAPVVVLDACVLYPAAQRDLFMWLAAEGVIRAHWTQQIHREWMRNVSLGYGITHRELKRIASLMDSAAGDALIYGYRRYEDLFPGTDEKDRHVAAAAFAALRRAKASSVTVITWNLKDFDSKEMLRFGIGVMNPDRFLQALMATSSAGVLSAFNRMSNNLRHPPKTPRECADTLAAQGLAQFAGLIKLRINP